MLCNCHSIHIYIYLNNKIRTKEGRKILYLRSGKFFPFKRLSFYVLDKILIQESNSYRNPTYEGLAGYILDLKHAIAHNYFNYNIYNNNYIYSINYIRKILSESKEQNYAIIDFGCGAGVFSRIVKNLFKNVKVIGLDVRKETMDCNAILYKDITWGLVSDIDFYIKDIDREKIILINDGVVNFMNETDIDEMLSKKIKYIVWFYYFSFSDPVKEYSKDKKFYLLTPTKLQTTIFHYFQKNIIIHLNINS